MNSHQPHDGRRILLVDDHAIVREGLRRIFESAGHGWAVTEESAAPLALDRLRREVFELLIIDLSMPGMSGIELIQRIRAHYPQQRVLVLSMHAEEEYALRAFKTGANGYVTKDCAAAELISAARKVAEGGTYVSASLAERVVQHLNGSVNVPLHAKLSNRELDVLHRIVNGERASEIAEALCLSVKTVSTHKKRVMEKLRISNTATLVRYGIENGMCTKKCVEPWPVPIETQD